MSGTLTVTHGHHLTDEDKTWINSAFMHETRFLKKFVGAVISGGGVMSYRKRAMMYANALDNVYNTGRLRGSPSDLLYYWVTSKRSNEPCKSCKWLEKMGPFTKYNLPTMPRSGATICLTNCHCRVVPRRVKPSQLNKPWKMYSKGYLLRKLREIKRKR
jgi:hypothetical protein